MKLYKTWIPAQNTTGITTGNISEITVGNFRRKQRNLAYGAMVGCTKSSI